MYIYIYIYIYVIIVYIYTFVVLTDTVAVDGKPRSDLPPRRSLWDTLKPQASAVSIV